MWHWQQNERARFIFWSKLFGISALLHVAWLGYFFIFYTSYDVYRLTLSASGIPKDVPIVFMPLQKRMSHGIVPVTSSTPSKKAVAKTNKKKDIKKNVQKNGVTAQEKIMPDNNATSTPSKKMTGLYSEEQAIKKTRKNKQEMKKISQRVREITKPKSADAEQKQREIEKIKTKKIEELKKVDAVKTEESKKIDNQLTTKQEPVQDAEQDLLEAVYVGQEEMMAMQIQQSLTQEISQHWKVPAGLAQDLVCEISVMVNWQGGVQQARIAKSSGVLMYDISARSAVEKIQLPKIAWGKEFVITFKQ